jgi:SpoVK/Ycf46/Vps4 family AAA+-type ATPase
MTKISLHAIFSGNPGTGKTTVARLYGKLLGALGFLQKGHLVETDRGGLVAEYAGQTATKTNARFEEALDGVLFIDEAYSLVNDGEDPYGAEAVQTLLKRMEDQRDRIVVILAGYPEPMENLLSTNPGLASRFGRTLHFADYSPVELCRIFACFCQRDSYALPAATRSSLIDGLTWHWKKRNERFGNGRLARNLFESSLRRLATRLSKIKAMSKALLSTLDANDLALDDVPEEVKKQIGQHRYDSLCFSCAKPLRVDAKQLGTEIVCPGCQKAQKVEWGEQVLAQ